jgi:hypothetical protein
MIVSTNEIDLLLIGMRLGSVLNSELQDSYLHHHGDPEEMKKW